MMCVKKLTLSTSMPGGGQLETQGSPARQVSLQRPWLPAQSSQAAPVQGDQQPRVTIPARPYTKNRVGFHDQTARAPEPVELRPASSNPHNEIPLQWLQDQLQRTQDPRQTARRLPQSPSWTPQN